MDLDRELSATYKEAQKELRGKLKMMLITFDSSENIEYNGVEIEIVNIFDFLLIE